jgi:hypothetical protein
MLSLVVLIIVFVINGTYSKYCRTVEVGQHFPSDHLPPETKRDRTISTQIQFNHDTAHYLFSPTDIHGQRCSESWNMLWGATRCGYETNNHQDSDRFVWRRDVSCLIYDSSGHVIGEKTNCPEANLIELAAYAYDDGLKPFQHIGKLLKQFSTKLHVNKWYQLTITFHETETTYYLSESDHHPQILETQTIHHRLCPEFTHGTMQSFYFGGICPAPQAVSVCYNKA